LTEAFDKAHDIMNRALKELYAIEELDGESIMLVLQKYYLHEAFQVKEDKKLEVVKED
jgi:hypothetical protein